MELISVAQGSALVQVILVDLLLAGDNAIVVGMAAAGLEPRYRTKVIVAGIAVAVVARIAFAVVTVQLLQITGLLVVGGLLLLWVSWRLWRELREHAKSAEAMRFADEATRNESARPRKTLLQATMQIVIADLSMSLDNVLAVAGIAREHAWVLVFGLMLSVVLMGVAAAYIARLLARHMWIGYLGLALIVYVALAMISEGSVELIPLLGG